jgi:hypothetical protein
MSQKAETRRAGGAAAPLETSRFWTRDKREIAPNRTRAQAEREARLQFLAGLKPLFYSLDELERGAALRPFLERCGALPADFIKALGGDKFLTALRAIDGERP